ncbi:MAG: hypothetical protein HYU80_04225 [Candidatus Blackburnbacteria bacterium]|nr:hypothetical protein [Candidatus Blackburnbacteria bacterium]
MTEQGTELGRVLPSEGRIRERLVRIVKSRTGLGRKKEQDREVLLVDPEQKKKHLADAQEIVLKRAGFLRDLPAAYRKEGEDSKTSWSWVNPFENYWRERARWGDTGRSLEIIRSLVGSPIKSKGSVFVELLSSCPDTIMRGLSNRPNKRKLALYEATVLHVPRGHEFLEKYKDVLFGAWWSIDILWNDYIDPEKPTERYQQGDRYSHVVANTLRRGEQWWRVAFGDPRAPGGVPTRIIYATSEVRPDIVHSLPSPNRQDIDIDLVQGTVEISTYQDPETYSVYMSRETGPKVDRVTFKLTADGWASPTSGENDAFPYVPFVREIAETIPKEMFIGPRSGWGFS